MSIERNFNDYLLGDNVYELANELIPEVANTIGVDIGQEPSAESLKTLIGVLGKNKVLRDNEPPVEIDLEQAATWVERSGVQRPLARSLWTPDVTLETAGVVDTLIVTGGVANWMERGARLALNFPSTNFVVGATGNRIMDSASDTANPLLQSITAARHDAPLIEADFQEFLLRSDLQAADAFVFTHQFDTKDGRKIAELLVEEASDLFDLDSKVVCARVANAGIQFACQIRAAARAHNPGFDSDSENPQLYVLTDTLPIAQTPEQLTDTRNFQSPYTALRQVAVTAKSLHEAALGDV